MQGTASHQVALLEQRRAPSSAVLAAARGCFWALSSPPVSAQCETLTAPLGTSPRAVQQQESLGCLSVWDTELRDVPPWAWGRLLAVAKVAKVAKAALGMASPRP